MTATFSDSASIGVDDVVIIGASWRWRHEFGEHVPRVAVCRSDGRIAAACLSGQVLIFDPLSGSVAAELTTHSLGALDVAWSPDGGALATGGQDGIVRITDTSTGDVLGTHRGSGWASRVVWSNDGTRLAAAIGRETVLMARDGRMLGSFGRSEHTVADLVWTTDDRRLGVLAYGGVKWFGTGTPKEQPDKSFAWKGSPLRAAMSPAGNYLAHGNQDNSVHVWRMSSADEMEMLGYPAKVEVLGWHAGGAWLAIGTVGMTTVWDCSGKGPAGRKAVVCVGHDRRVSALAWTVPPLPPVLITASADGTVQWYRPTEGKVSGELEPLGGVMVGGEIVDLVLLPSVSPGSDGTSRVNAAVARHDGLVGVIELSLPTGPVAERRGRAQIRRSGRG
jgi:WD40 repeat protein